MIRKLAGLIAGLAIAVILIIIIEAFGHRLFPPPAGPDVYGPTAPGGASGGAAVSVVAAWFVGVLAGAWTAVSVSRTAWTGWAIASLFLLSAIYNFTLIRHPTWMIVAGIAAIAAAAYIAQRLPRKRFGRD